MITPPFITNFPLSDTPYYSRISTNLEASDVKNYYLVGFKPGFPLQASELNEIQEQFLVQQTLTNTCINSWWGKGTSGPFWLGATPLKYSDLTVSAGAGSTTPIVTLPAGWIYTVSASTNTDGLGVWIYNDTTRSFSMNVAQTEIYGVWVKNEMVDYTVDTDLSDNSGGGARTGYGFINSGADRFAFTITGSGVSTGTAPDSDSVFYPIVSTNSDGSTVKTINGYTIYTKV